MTQPTDTILLSDSNHRLMTVEHGDPGDYVWLVVLDLDLPTTDFWGQIVRRRPSSQPDRWILSAELPTRAAAEEMIKRIEARGAVELTHWCMN
jgi:hypothetical protein